MVIVLKRSNLFILALSAFLTISTINMADYADITPASAIPVSDKVIVIDAGHGASDGGAIGIEGTIEKDINLKIAQKLQSLLEKTGATVILTRSDDSPIANSKREDMHLRKDIKTHSDAHLFISIHMNKFPQSKYRGAQVFYANDEESKLLGEKIQNEMIKILDPTNNRTAKKAEESIFILKGSNIPSVIVECGFLSNPEEEHLLNQGGYQDKVAWAIYSGVTEYFSGKRSGK